MKSHFQRSDGFEVCSQLLADTGWANASVAMPANAGSPGNRWAMSARTCAALVYLNGTPSAMPRFTRICQSSMASSGGGMARAVPCRRPWSFV